METAKTATSIVVMLTSCASKAPPPSKIRTASQPSDNTPRAAPVERTAIVLRFVPKTFRNARLSPRSAAAASAGKAAMANWAPMTSSGIVWNLRAQVRSLTDPDCRVDASAVK